MDNNEKMAIDTPKKITVGIVLSWIVGILLVLMAIGVFTNSVLGGFAVLIGGLILIPPVNAVITKKLNLSLSGGIRTIIAIVLFGIGVSTMPPTVKDEVTGTDTQETVATETASENTQPETAPVVNNTETASAPTPNTETTQATAPVVTPAPTPAPAPTNTRADDLAKLKANASAKWGDNYQMVKFEYDNQVEAYDWVMAQTAHPDIMAKAKQKWGMNYQMVKFEYDNQVEAYNSL